MKRKMISSLYLEFNKFGQSDSMKNTFYCLAEEWVSQ